MIIEKDILKMAKEKFDTPFYIFDKKYIEDRCNLIRRTIPESFELYYSAKANPNPSIISIICGIFGGLEASSIGEIVTALDAGVSACSVLFVGPMKKSVDLFKAYELGVRKFILESVDQIEAIRNLSLPEVQVILRLNPDININSSSMKMGGRATQFGIDVAQLPEIWKILEKKPKLDFRGYHTYCGTQISNVETTISIILEMVKIYHNTPINLRSNIDFMDFGGGFSFGVDGEPKEYNIFELASRLQELDNSLPTGVRCAFELGRFVVAPVGKFCVSIVSLKESKGKQFAICDGGINGFYGYSSQSIFKKRNFKMQSITNSESSEKIAFRGNVVGPLCTPADVLAENVQFDGVAQGDLLIFEECGAYGLTHSMTKFLSHNEPSELLFDPANGALRKI